ncbi:hypothetical protein HDU91_007038 [Kappamyces sp. JEL0680]|nr:hypothetical protein HDU91_007038 [Kappamyces sp. JEL0680]
MSTSFVVGFDSSRLVAATPIGVQYGQVLGTVMLNFAIVTIIPSWINIKRKDVSVQNSVWSTISIVTLFYVASGVILAGGYSNITPNVLSTLVSLGKPSILTKFFVYIFAFVMLIPSIPVNLIISKENLFQNDIVSEKLAIVVSFVLPWLVVFPLQTGNSLLSFQTWTSSLFVSTSNFIVPVIIYFRCVEFRSKYNVDRELSEKQIDLLKRIHSRSNALVRHLDRKRQLVDQTLVNLSNPLVSIIDASDNPQDHIAVVNPAMTSVDLAVTSLNVPAQGHHHFSEISSESLNNLIDENVPDPDREDMEDGRYNPNQPSLVSRLKTNLVRRATRAPQRSASELPPETIEIDTLPPRPSAVSLPRLSDVEAGPSLLDAMLQSQTAVNLQDSHSQNSSQVSVKEGNSNFSLLDIPVPPAPFARTSWEPAPLSAPNRLERLKTLPTHPNFRSPAFRSVPKWMPIRGYHMAWIVLVVTSFVTIGNIIINFIPQ